MFKKIKSEKNLENEQEGIEETLKNIIIFPGSVQEYERFRGYEVEIIDTKLPNKGVNYEDLTNLLNSDNRNLAFLLMREGVEALVNVTSLVSGHVHHGWGDFNSPLYGLPVRRKLK